MKYIISYTQPNSQFIDVEYIIDNVNQDMVRFQLPAWRPGRYELGNFAKNIQKWMALDAEGNALSFKKVKKDLWEVQTNGASEIHIKYNYYAAELNAGSTWLDDSQIYMNPVNCCLYVPERIDEPCDIELHVPEDYKVATGLKTSPLNPSPNKEKDKHQTSNIKRQTITLQALNFHELADSPFIASATLAHNMFVYEGTEFNVWFQGLNYPLWSKLLSDFFVFINEQYVTFGDFPVKEYHFLFQVLPYKAYHGVEHQNSTVITLGPTYAVMEGELYNELLGVSSHELFHTWNIKKIRPSEMFPYDYSAENYSRLGYVAEGVTTYYGDLMLFRSGVFKEKEYFETFNAQLQKHFDNFGRFNLSVAESSFDTWLDGYNPGIPGRKVSIYTEGCLLAFITDVLIRRNTQNGKSLDDVLRILYNDFGKQNKGYTDRDYLNTLKAVSGISFEGFAQKYIYGTESYEELLKESCQYLGLLINKKPSIQYHESALGIKVIEDGGKTVIKNIWPDSIAAHSGLMINDQIIAVNGFKVNSDLGSWCKHCAKFFKGLLNFTVMSSGRKKEISLQANSEIYYQTYTIEKEQVISPEQTESYNSWAKGIKKTAQ